MDKQEEQFIRRINAKEEEGFKELFEKYYRYLVIAAGMSKPGMRQKTSYRMPSLTCGNRKKLSIHQSICNNIYILL